MWSNYGQIWQPCWNRCEKYPRGMSGLSNLGQKWVSFAIKWDKFQYIFCWPSKSVLKSDLEKISDLFHLVLILPNLESIIPGKLVVHIHMFRTATTDRQNAGWQLYMCDVIVLYKFSSIYSSVGLRRKQISSVSTGFKNILNL